MAAVAAASWRLMPTSYNRSISRLLFSTDIGFPGLRCPTLCKRPVRTHAPIAQRAFLSQTAGCDAAGNPGPRTLASSAAPSVAAAASAARAAPGATSALSACAARPTKTECAASHTTAEAAAIATFLRSCFIHGDIAAFETPAVQRRDCGLRFLIAAHLYESETFGTSRIAIGDHLRRHHCAMCTEYLLQLLLAYVVTQIAYINS